MSCVVLLIVFSFCSLLTDGQKLTYVTSEKFDKTYLVRTDQKSNFTQAKDFCHSNGGRMAKIESRDEWLWFVENVAKKHGLENPWYWIGATPVGRGQTVSHWLDGTKIVNFFWQSESHKTYNSDFNGLVIDTNNNEPRFHAWPCSLTWSVICEVDQTARTLMKITSKIIENQLRLNSTFISNH